MKFVIKSPILIKGESESHFIVTKDRMKYCYLKYGTNEDGYLFKKRSWSFVQSLYLVPLEKIGVM